MKRTPLAPMSTKRRADLKRRAIVRQEVLDRDGFRCQFWAYADATGADMYPWACGGPLDVHELIPRSADPTGWLRSGSCVSLCRRHHEWVGDHPSLAHAIGLHGFSWERTDQPSTRRTP